MKKMIEIINENLRTVINGIKKHREDAEETLINLKGEIEEKINLASVFRDKVEEAKQTIETIEGEIADLEKYFEELKIKFGSDDFKETLMASNKEVNSKIVEKRTLINEQSKVIQDLTDKAHLLKTELTKLKERRDATEDNLEKTKVLEKYYENRVMDIINYAAENPDDLDAFVVELPREQLNISELEEVDINAIVDGSVFEEIDEISQIPKEEKESNDTLKSTLTIEEQSLSEEEKSEFDLSMTQQLDDIILNANSILEKSKDLSETPIKEEKKQLEETDAKDDKIEEKFDLFADLKELDFVTPVEDETINLYTNDSLEEQEIKPEHFDNVLTNDDTIKREEENSISTQRTNDELKLDLPFDLNSLSDDILNNVVDDIVGLDNTPLQSQASEESTYIMPDIDLKMNEDNVIREESFTEETKKNLTESLQECGLNADMFTSKDLEKLNSKFNVNNTKQFIEMMNKHNISIETLYSSVNTLLNVTPQNLDYMLTLLKKAKASEATIEVVFDKLADVNISKLEKEINRDLNRELVEILYETMAYIPDNDFTEKIDLTSDEVNTLKKNTTDREFKIMNMFSNVVKLNYDALNKFGIEDIKECFTKHPRRFISNPDKFSEILDKYDPEDLVRCINKNSAVIDKL